LSSPSQTVPESHPSALMEEERRELEAVAAALGNSSRLLRLITYIGEKYFQGKTDKLHEYDIATEVFGRSKDTFNAGEDAIVRVEAHRLRKRLTEYYAGEGKDHPIHLSIPPGAYVPVFTRQPSGPAKLDSESPRTLARRASWRWSYVMVAIAAFGLTILSGYLLFRAYSAKKEGPPSGARLPMRSKPLPRTPHPTRKYPCAFSPATAENRRSTPPETSGSRTSIFILAGRGIVRTAP
jgi:hypothetical protein